MSHTKAEILEMLKLSEAKFQLMDTEQKEAYTKTASTLSDKIRSEIMTSYPLGFEYEFFYGKESAFSQFYPCRFIVDNLEFNCCEQYMMYQKALFFNDNMSAENILDTPYNPKKYKELGRDVVDFDPNEWDKVKSVIVYNGNFEKFNQNEQLQKILIETYPKTLVEASPDDTIWGIGLSISNPDRFHQSMWKGENMLGYILTDVRDRLMLNKNV